MDLPPGTTPQPSLLHQPASGAVVVKPEINTIPEPNQSISTPQSKETVLPLRPPAITIPSYSRWFSWTSIHETEQKLLPEFFDGKSPSRNPNFYKRVRDSIIRKYYDGFSKKITFTDVRRGLIADVGSVRKVFDFLETWGLINYTPPPVTKEKEREKKKSVEKKGNNVEGVVKKDNNTEDAVTKTCSGCGTICSQACFSTEKTDIILCARCFVRGNYRAGLTSSDFKRLDIEEAAAASASSGGRAASGQIKSEWSEKETLHLLESILHYGDDWKKVAEHVGNGRSQLECIDRFIKLPFGEQFMPTVGGGEQDLGFSENEKEEDVDDDDSNMEAKRLRLNPLADTSNPIMAQVAFLSAMVGSDVADAAASAAVNALTDELVMDSASHTNLVVRKEEPITRMEEDVDMENGDGSKRKMLEEAFKEAKVQLKREHEDLEQSISDIVSVQMKELHKKMDHFEAIELLMEKESSQLRQMQKHFFADQLSSLQHNNRSLETAVMGKIKPPPR